MYCWWQWSNLASCAMIYNATTLLCLQYAGTAVHWAAEHGHLQVVQYMVETAMVDPGLMNMVRLSLWSPCLRMFVSRSFLRANVEPVPPSSLTIVCGTHAPYPPTHRHRVSFNEQGGDSAAQVALNNQKSEVAQYLESVRHSRC